jgi:hypothetical protein
LAVSRDVAEIQQALADTTGTLARLDALVVRKDKVGLFSDLARVRELSAELRGGLTTIRGPFLPAAGAASLAAGTPAWFKQPASFASSETVSLFGQAPPISAAAGENARARVEPGVAALLSRASAVEAQIKELEQRIEHEAGERLTILNDQIATERARSEAGQRTLQALLGETHNLGEVLLAQAIDRAKTRLYELVIRSDAGLLDVSWGEKDARTREIIDLVARQKRELGAADAEFEQSVGEP